MSNDDKRDAVDREERDKARAALKKCQREQTETQATPAQTRRRILPAHRFLGTRDRDLCDRRFLCDDRRVVRVLERFAELV
jgi:hypothetical protein